MYRLSIDTPVYDMIDDATEWYEMQQPILAKRFLDNLGNVFQKITSHPELYSTYRKKYRQAKLETFPYLVVYEIIADEIFVFAVIHTARHPKNKIKR